MIPSEVAIIADQLARWAGREVRNNEDITRAFQLSGLLATEGYEIIKATPVWIGTRK